MKIKIKKITTIFLLLAMLLQIIVPVATLAAEGTISIKFEDDNLYKAICERLEDKLTSKNDVTLTIQIERENLNNVTSLILKNKEIKNITGLDSFSALNYLDLSGNKLNEESNLEILNNINSLEEVDLSSNKIRNIEKIENLFYNLNAKFIIQNQEFMDVQIVGYDTNKQETEQLVQLAQILKYIDEADVEIEATYKDRMGEEKTLAIPYPDETATIKIKAGKVIEEVKGEEGNVIEKYRYELQTGRIKIVYKVVANDFNRSKIDNRLIIIDSYNEKGIIFKDKNLYQAIKEQLTEGQEINNSLAKYTASGNLYNAAYDEELVLVISKDNLYNKITHLILNNRQIEDLTGLEEFVALSENIDSDLTAKEMMALSNDIETSELKTDSKFTNLILDLSQNYISDVTQLKTLMENKAIAEQELMERLNEIIEIIRTLNGTLKGYENEYKALTGSEEKIGEIKEQRNAIYNYVKPQKTEEGSNKEDALMEKINSIGIADVQDDEAIATTISELYGIKGESVPDNESDTYKSLASMLKALKTKMARANELGNNLIKKTQTTIIAKVNSAYNIYNNLPELIELITDDVQNLTNEQILYMNFETAKNHIVTNLNILKEKFDDLTTIEKSIYGYASKEEIDAIIQDINSITSDEQGQYISRLKEILKGLRDKQEDITKMLLKNEDNQSNKETMESLKAKLDELKQYINNMNNINDDMTEGEKELTDEHARRIKELLEGLYEALNNSGIDKEGNILNDINELIEKIEELISKGQNQGSNGSIVSQVRTIMNQIENLINQESISILSDEDMLIIARRLENAKLDKVELAKLNAFNLSQNNISDLSVLAAMDDIKYLDLSTNLIMDISGLENANIANTLLYLELGNNDARVIGAIQGYNKLKYLGLGRNYITQEELDKVDFSKLEKLECLTLQQNQISNLSTLLNQLKKLDAFAKDENGNLLTSKDEVMEKIFANINVKSQILTLEFSVPKSESAIKVELPQIFRQVEQYQPKEVSFVSDITLLSPITLQQGTITLARNEVGKFQKIIGINGGIATGTICVINYEVKEETEPTEPTNPEDSVNVTGVTLDKQEVVIVAGGRVKINANVEPENASNKNLIWTSSNENIATVENGNITGVNVGDATITVKTEDGNFEATCKVTVQELVYLIDDENGYVFNISPNTNVETFKNILSSEYECELYDAQGNKIESNEANVATGMKIRLSNGEEFTLVVKGDVNGDGQVKGNDATLIRLYRAGNEGLTGAYLRAADVNNDSKVNGVDSTLVMLHRAGISGYIL